jgi:hypothetical protein
MGVRRALGVRNGKIRKRLFLNLPFRDMPPGSRGERGSRDQATADALTPAGVGKTRSLSQKVSHGGTEAKLSSYANR